MVIFKQFTCIFKLHLVLFSLTCLSSYKLVYTYDHIGSDLGNANASEEHMSHDDEDENE